MTAKRRVRHVVAVALAVALALAMSPAPTAAIAAGPSGLARWTAAFRATASGVTASVSKGTNGWYWPTGTNDVGSMGGWMDYRSSNKSWHLAKDIGAPYGSPVYAAADGVVFSAYSNLDGYGPGGGPGGAIVILFRREDGAYFKALYGHLNGLKYKTGQAVKAGAVIGYVNNTSPNHVHFGIHPGSALPTDPQHNPFRGHTYVKSQTYGWTDPIAFLKAHTPYVPPVPATLGAPSVPPLVAAGTLVSITATVSPAQDRGCSVVLERWRLVGSTWTFIGASRMATRPRSLAWRCSVLLSAGAWRVRTRFSGDRDHSPGTSAYTTVTAG